MAEKNEETNTDASSKNTSEEKKTEKNRVLSIVAVLLLVSFIVFTYLFLKESVPYWIGNKSYSDMNKSSQSQKKLKVIQ